MRREIVLLAALYFVQGLPFGFQAAAVPVLLREAGASLTLVGFSGALALPWLLKPLFAPWVDQRPRRRKGRRKAWMVPLQALLAAAALVTGWVGLERFAALLSLVLIMNLFAATLDIAVDGLAVDVLRERELGIGNAVQVVGYKLGMLCGGGMLLVALAYVSFVTAFGLIALAIVLVLLATWRFDEPLAGELEHTTVRAVVQTLMKSVALPGGRWLLLVVATYKLGESMADAMFKPFVFDAGYSKEQIGLWVGTWGMAFSIAGSLAGGVAASRFPLLKALWWTAILRVVPLVGQWWLVRSGAPSADGIIVVTCAEHLFGGALTTAMFAFMMSRVDKRIGATHFTLLAAVEVLGKTPASWLSGLLADHAGYSVVFSTAVVLSLAFIALLPPLRRRAS